MKIKNLENKKCCQCKKEFSTTGHARRHEREVCAWSSKYGEWMPKSKVLKLWKALKRN